VVRLPRAKKTIGGVPGQAVQAIQGQTYGEATRQEALQKTMPAPNAEAPMPQAPTATPTAPQPPMEQVPQPRLSLQDAMEQIRGRGGVLSMPDDNPSLPVTDGLMTGPGRGPEALMANSTLGNTLRRLANQTGDPIFRELASKVRF
jgi:hypothetical protein